MKPDYYTKPDGTVVMSYTVFRNLDPFHVSAMCRGNLRGSMQKTPSENRPSRTPWAKHVPVPRVKVLVTVGQR